MRSIFIVAVAASAALAGCTFNSTTVRRAEVPPPATVVYATPAPTVVYQQPTVVARAPIVAYASAGGNVPIFEVRGMTDFGAAKSRAESVCRSQYGGVAHYLDRTPGPNSDTVRFECAG